MVRAPNGRDKRKPRTSRISAQPVRILAVYMGAAGAKDPGQTTARANSRALLAAGGKGRELELAAARVVVIASMSQYRRQFPPPPAAAARNSFSDAGQRWRG
jgi:hypothetical protein